MRPRRRALRAPDSGRSARDWRHRRTSDRSAIFSTERSARRPHAPAGTQDARAPQRRPPRDRSPERPPEQAGADAGARTGGGRREHEFVRAAFGLELPRVVLGRERQDQHRHCLPGQHGDAAGTRGAGRGRGRRVVPHRSGHARACLRSRDARDGGVLPPGPRGRRRRSRRPAALHQREGARTWRHRAEQAAGGGAENITMNRYYRRSIVVLTAALLVCLAALCITPSVRVEPTPLPAQIADKAFWRMIVDFSEAGGFFRSDNLVSNETAFQHVIPELQRTLAPGGVYIGVGPDQNFTYIAALHPRIAF